MKHNQEIFKDVVGYESMYQVSNLGTVISLERTKYKNQYVKSKTKSINDNGYGYKTVNLWKDNKGKTFYVHRLIVEAFIGEIPKDMQVNHINGVKSDNFLSNLEIVTRSENILHAHKNGLTKDMFGQKVKRSKTGYSNICIKQDKAKSYFVVCIRTKEKRFERRFSDLYEAIVIHNQYMREIGKPNLIHTLIAN